MTQSSFASNLRRLWPRAPAPLIGKMIETSDAIFARYGITTPLRLAHFMAQISHESSGGTITAENMNYTTAARIAAVWPSRFTAASAAAYVRNPKKLASKVYNGRMGNKAGTDDGYTYRGRGLLQITGRESYADMAKRTGLDLVGNPDLAFDPRHALEIAAAEFKKLNCLSACDADDVRLVTRRVNGGTIGLAERKAWLAKWKAALLERPVGLLSDSETADDADPDAAIAHDDDDAAAAPAADSEAPAPALPAEVEAKGDPEILSVQHRLKAMNYNPGRLEGDWGGMTAEAIGGFLNDRPTSLPGPTSLEMFQSMRADIKAELSRAEAEGFKRPVSAARASADPETVAEVAPEIKPVNRGFLATAWASFLTFMASIWNAISGYASQAWDFFTDHKDDLPDTDSGIVSTVWGYVSAVPTSFWILLGAAGLGAVAWQVHRAKAQITAQVQSGARK
jgi:putative chitinase